MLAQVPIFSWSFVFVIVVIAPIFATRDVGNILQHSAQFSQPNTTEHLKSSPSRFVTHLMFRWKKVLQPGLSKGHWTADEDEIIRREVATAEAMERVSGIPSKTYTMSFLYYTLQREANDSRFLGQNTVGK